MLSLGKRVNEKGELVPTIISITPVDHRFLVFNTSSTVVGKPPKNAASLGEHNTDFHPIPCSLRPVSASSVTDP